jgi:hypothetical protein
MKFPGPLRTYGRPARHNAIERQRLPFECSDLRQNKDLLSLSEALPSLERYRQTSNITDLTFASEIHNIQHESINKLNHRVDGIAVDIYEAPPSIPSIPARSRAACVCSLACVAMSGCLVLFLLLTVEAPFVLNENAYLWRDRKPTLSVPKSKQALAQYDTNSFTASIGFWDQLGTITSRQLTIALSAAIGIEEKRLSVIHQGEHFFFMNIKNVSRHIISEMDSPSFISIVNNKASQFGGNMVISHRVDITL